MRKEMEEIRKGRIRAKELNMETRLQQTDDQNERIEQLERELKEAKRQASAAQKAADAAQSRATSAELRSLLKK